jgi:hypothetical protein
MGLLVPVVVVLVPALGIAAFITWRRGLLTMRVFCCAVAIVLFGLAVALGFDTDAQFRVDRSGGGPAVVAPNFVRGMGSLGFCLGGGAALIAAAVSAGRADNRHAEPGAAADGGGR